MAEPVIYTMAIMKNGEVLATKSVRTYLEGAVLAVTPHKNALREIEMAWAVRGMELARDILHREGRFEKMRAAQNV